MSKSQKTKTIKSIKVSIQNNDDTKVKVDFAGGSFTPDEFTAMFMAILESYTVGLLETNTNEAVFNHFNRVFGIFLNKILPEEEIYKKSAAHRKYKRNVDKILSRKLTPEEQRETEDNRFAAYLLARDILINDAHLDEESVDLLLNKRLNNIEKIN